jgi:hypothetical protein
MGPVRKSHNIHPVAKVNREWNRIQPPATPVFSYPRGKEEFIPVKMQSPPLDVGLFRGFENVLLCRDRGERHISRTGERIVAGSGREDILGIDGNGLNALTRRPKKAR